MISALVLALGLLGPAALRAEVMIERLEWQLAQPVSVTRSRRVRVPFVKTAIGR